jgi:FtsH-binding integral membrane protein
VNGTPVLEQKKSYNSYGHVQTDMQDTFLHFNVILLFVLCFMFCSECSGNPLGPQGNVEIIYCCGGMGLFCLFCLSRMFHKSPAHGIVLSVISCSAKLGRLFVLLIDCDSVGLWVSFLLSKQIKC